MHKAEFISLQLKLIGSCERFIYYNKGFKTCNVIKLRNRGINGRKYERFWKKLSTFCLIFQNMLMKNGIVSSNLLFCGQGLVKFSPKLRIFMQLLGNFCQEVGFFGINWLLLAIIRCFLQELGNYCQELGHEFFVMNWVFFAVIGYFFGNNWV